jgi:hypothetical protein
MGQGSCQLDASHVSQPQLRHGGVYSDRGGQIVQDTVLVNYTLHLAARHCRFLESNLHQID